MSVFINGIGSISPQKSFDQAFLKEGFTQSSGIRLACTEPDYTQFVDVKNIRRMSRVIKMSVASAFIALKEAGVENPDGVIAASGLGCLEDTNTFLKKLVLNKEEMLNPTAFIYSTHNSISSQIAYLLQCRGYNSTYVHRNVSFENALLDAFMLIKENECETVLTGGADELTDTSFHILSRFGLFKKAEISTEKLFESNSPGTIAGEGASFFALSSKQSSNCYGKLLNVSTISFKDTRAAISRAKELLAENNIEQADLILSGNNGDNLEDIRFEEFKNAFPSSPALNFKHLCGEYPTASAFGMWMGASILKNGLGFPYLATSSEKKEVKNILIFNAYKKTHQSLILLSAC